MHCSICLPVRLSVMVPCVGLAMVLFIVQPEPPPADVLRYFAKAAEGGLAHFLAQNQPAPVPDEERLKIVAALPREGEVSPTRADRTKLAGIREVLAFYGGGNAIQVRVVRLPYACAALHARSVLILAESALTRLTTAQAQAIAAHELAHLYYWQEYYAARDRGDALTLQRIELQADGIAIYVLNQLGLPASELTAALRRLNSFNNRYGTPSNPMGYPPWKQRVNFHRAFDRAFRDKF